MSVRAPFGRMLTAMVTPFDVAGALDLDTAAALATYLVDEMGNDGLVVNGTTGESPTTTDDEKAELIRAVVDAVGDRAQVHSGVGTFDTVHSVHLAQSAAKAGAHGVLVVTPYYSRPPQAGLLQYFRTVADATDLPVMLYDIPGRTGTPIATETMLRLAEHSRILGVKDAKGDLIASSQVISETGLAFYSGDDAYNAAAARGRWRRRRRARRPTSVASATKAMIEAFERGDTAKALRRHQQLLPIYRGIFATQGCILVKAGLALIGRPVGSVRPPLVDATEHEVSHLRADLAAAGLAVD